MYKRQVLLFSTSVYSQSLNRALAKKILFRTNRVITSAKKDLEKNHHFSGHFSKSFGHQILAISYFRKGRYDIAVYHSLKSRNDANTSIRNNNGRLPIESKFDIKENSYFTHSPAVQVLEKELENENIPKEEDLIKESCSLPIE